MALCTVCYTIAVAISPSWPVIFYPVNDTITIIINTDRYDFSYLIKACYRMV